MDVFYEESAVAKDAKKGARRYRIVNIIGNIFLILGIIMIFIFIFTMPFGTPNFSGITDPSQLENSMALYEGGKFIAIFCGLNGALFVLVWFLLYKFKARLNMSYDYCFVTGELRISRVININKRRLLTRFESEEILQIGDIDNSSYERLKSDPSTKEIICTPNVEPMEGKFFMYILINDNGKKLYILECREQLLVHILKFAQRSVLESDYVMQEKKNKV